MRAQRAKRAGGGPGGNRSPEPGTGPDSGMAARPSRSTDHRSEGRAGVILTRGPPDQDVGAQLHISYVALGVPAVIAGVAVVEGAGLVAAGAVYGLAVMVLARHRYVQSHASATHSDIADKGEFR